LEISNGFLTFQTMRIYLLLLSLLFFSFQTPRSAVHTKPSGGSVHNRECLELCGIATIKGKPVTNVNVKLYLEDKLVNEVASTEKEKVFFTLRENSKYTLVYSLPGYFTRMISINTWMPAKVKREPAFTFEFSLELFSEDEQSYTYYLDFPVALIRFNPSAEKFECNRIYASSIRKEPASSSGVHIGAISGK
jgi:hypothetical protein